MLSKFFLLGLLTATSFKSFAAEFPFKDFLSSCKDTRLESSTVYSTCRAENKGFYYSRLPFRGIANHNGVLTIDENSTTVGEITKNCKNLSIDSKAVLGGQCKDNAGNFVWSFVDISKLFANYNGTLVYKSNENKFNDIVSTCSGMKTTYASVEAQCLASNGAAYRARIRLRGINNINGILTIDHEDSRAVSLFHVTCKNATIDQNAILTASCPNTKNEDINSSIDLKPLLSNYNGSLVSTLD